MLRPKTWRAVVVAVLTLWCLIAGAGYSCDPVVEVGKGCEIVYGNWVLVHVCLHDCDLDAVCRSVGRWKRAGWGGGVEIVWDAPRELGTACRQLDNVIYNVFPQKNPKKLIWCDKLAALKLFPSHHALYADTDLVPGDCLSSLTPPSPTALSLYPDTYCLDCNKLNAGLIWAPPTPQAASILTTWEDLCRKHPSHDDQIVLDGILETLPEGVESVVQLPREVRYMSSKLWGLVPGTVLRHYTHSVRDWCGIRP